MTFPLLEILSHEGSEKGPVLLVLGGVHGNEPGGSASIRDIDGLIKSGGLDIVAGQLIMVPEVNRKALDKGERFIDRDLNRNLGMVETPTAHEDHIANQLCPLLQQTDILLDLHGYGGGHTPFVFLGPPDRNELDFARALGVDYYCWGFADVTTKAQDNNVAIGTTEYCRLHGGYGVTLECGYKYDVQATARVGKRAVLNALEHLGMVRSLHDESAEDDPSDDHFVKLFKAVIKSKPGHFLKKWAHLDVISKNTPIAEYEDGSQIMAEQDCYIVLPDEDTETGTAWFYLGVEQNPL